jgi:hypothetical protein
MWHNYDSHSGAGIVPCDSGGLACNASSVASKARTLARSRYMTHSLKSVVAKHGYAFIGEYRLRASTVDVANEIGHTITPWEGGLIQELVPRATAPPNTYSGIYGIDRFPFHTDLAHWRLPPRYLLLRCLNG